FLAVDLYRSFILHFSFNDTVTYEIYTLSLHDALPIYMAREFNQRDLHAEADAEIRNLVFTGKARSGDLALHAALAETARHQDGIDRKSTRLNSSHVKISYAVFCLKKKKKKNTKTSAIQ